MSVMGIERVGSAISMLCFHSDANVASDGVLVELIMMGIIFGAERWWKPLEKEREREREKKWAGGGRERKEGKRGKKRAVNQISDKQKVNNTDELFGFYYTALLHTLVTFGDLLPRVKKPPPENVPPPSSTAPIKRSHKNNNNRGDKVYYL